MLIYGIKVEVVFFKLFQDGFQFSAFDCISNNKGWKHHKAAENQKSRLILLVNNYAPNAYIY